MGRGRVPAIMIDLSADERRELEGLAQRRRTAQGLARRKKKAPPRSMASPEAREGYHETVSALERMKTRPSLCEADHDRGKNGRLLAASSPFIPRVVKLTKVKPGLRKARRIVQRGGMHDLRPAQES